MEPYIQKFIAAFQQNIIVADRWLQLLQGLGVTLLITLFAIVVGTVLGFVLAFMKMSNVKFLSAVAKTYINIIRGTPMVVQLLIAYFVIFTSPVFTKVFVSIVAFGLNSGGYIAEIVRAGVMAVDHGQVEAGRSLGLNKWQTTVSIVLPQAIKNILPTYANEFTMLVKETAIVGYIGLNDITKVGDTIRSRTYNAFFPLISVAVVYYIITSFLSRVFVSVERRLRESDSR